MFKQKSFVTKNLIVVKKTEFADQVHKVQENNKNGPTVKYRPMSSSGL